jgi:hypothetical protein
VVAVACALGHHSLAREDRRDIDAGHAYIDRMRGSLVTASAR